uniref:Uncharacterized protein n=1 Tax=Timema poppense TaxID=170557 RepID=A0A7R9CY76_TIMPO|nr:unnamed protein product [Timema poppensis]
MTHPTDFRDIETVLGLTGRDAQNSARSLSRPLSMYTSEPMCRYSRLLDVMGCHRTATSFSSGVGSDSPLTLFSLDMTVIIEQYLKDECHPLPPKENSGYVPADDRQATNRAKAPDLSGAMRI